ncbi:MAG: zinc ribbon domain-containing protein [Anaerolineales bacterium]|nr:zinc ribbon domain-containing protein [Anaerolineales bacterium]
MKNFCSNCGSKLSQEMKFCGNCGASIANLTDKDDKSLVVSKDKFKSEQTDLNSKKPVATNGRRGCLAFACYGLAFVLPLFTSIGSGISTESVQTGIVVGIGTFLAFFIIGTLLLATAPVPSWLMVFSPFLVGLGYAVLPITPFMPVDDVLVVAAGGLVSYAIALRTYTDLPKDIIVPILGAAVYAIVGEYIPTPVDDLLVNGFIGYTVYSKTNGLPLLNGQTKVIPHPLELEEGI